MSANAPMFRLLNSGGTEFGSSTLIIVANAIVHARATAERS